MNIFNPVCPKPNVNRVKPMGAVDFYPERFFSVSVGLRDDKSNACICFSGSIFNLAHLFVFLALQQNSWFENVVKCTIYES